MSRGLIFWILMLIWFVFGLVVYSGNGPVWSYYPIANQVFLFVLFVLLGWQCYGAPIKD
jgi:hypothetical protein